MTKLEMISELLVEELHGFKKETDRLEGLTKNLNEIKVRADSREVERMLRLHLKGMTDHQDENKKQMMEVFANSRTLN